MKLKNFNPAILFGALITPIFLLSCDDSDSDVSYDIPATYTFERNGTSTVSYSGQTARLDMLAEMKTYLRSGDAGAELDADALLNMFANTNSPFSDDALNTSGKQIEDKTSALDVTFFKDLFGEAEAVSKDVAANVTDASNGTGGQILRVSNQSYVNVNGKGWEFTQMVEKGLMGALIYNQIFNSYLTDGKIGEGVENTTLEEGENFTTMEHHWDEAFGYLGVPVDFPNGTPALPEEYDRFWAEYIYGRDEDLGVAQDIMTAFITGRAAIVANDHETKTAQIDVIAAGLELVAAATAIHYINSALADLESGDQGNLFHHLSEGYGFVNAIKYVPNSKLSFSQVFDIKNTDFGTEGNFWLATSESLTTARTTIASAYPELTAIAESL